MRVPFLRLTLVLAMSATLAQGAEISERMRMRAEVSIDRGLEWLAKQQREDGSWSNAKYPALTALPMMAFARSSNPAHTGIVSTARSFVLDHAREDGGIYRKSRISLTGGLSTYNTAICLKALHALRDPALAPTLRAARAYLAAAQNLGGDESRLGGFGYNPSGFMSRSDLNNTVYSMEAMALTAELEDGRKGERVDIQWDKALEFLGRLQNDPTAEAGEAGGFFYSPTENPAGAQTNAADIVTFKAYGSMTYSGMLALLYANVSRDDPRVRSAFDWAQHHWTLEENPGNGATGLFFFYTVLTRSLNAFGADQIDQGEAGKLAWREAFIETVCGSQDAEGTFPGSWINDESKRYMEGDRALVTTYAILGLQNALGL